MVRRGEAKRADYILYYKPNIPLAVIEAKDNNCSVWRWAPAGPGIGRDAQNPVRVLFERRQLRLA
jgi:hypothetical protein